MRGARAAEIDRRADPLNGNGNASEGSRATFFCMPRTGSGFMSTRLRALLDDRVRIVGHTSFPFPADAETDAWSDAVSDAESGLGSPRPWAFCFVRDPYARLLSAYRWSVVPRSRNALDLKTRAAIGKYRSFADFAANIAKFTADPANSPIHFYPQSQWIRYGQGQIAMDYIGRFEQMDEAWETVSSALRLPYQPMRDQNRRLLRRWLAVTKGRTIDALHAMRWTPRAREAVDNYYRQDFDVFGYPE